MTTEEITLIPPGKLRCVVTNKLRSDTPEEHVRQRISRSLLEDYGYDKCDIEIEFTVNLGSGKKRVDIAIFQPRIEHKQQHIKIIVECKRDDVRPTDRDNGIEQLKSYLSACPNASFGSVVDHIEIPNIESVFIPNASKDIQIKIGKLVVSAFEKKDEANAIEAAAILKLEELLYRG